MASTDLPDDLICVPAITMYQWLLYGKPFWLRNISDANPEVLIQCSSRCLNRGPRYGELTITIPGPTSSCTTMHLIRLEEPVWVRESDLMPRARNLPRYCVESTDTPFQQLGRRAVSLITNPLGSPESTHRQLIGLALGLGLIEKDVIYKRVDTPPSTTTET